MTGQNSSDSGRLQEFAKRAAAVTGVVALLGILLLAAWGALDVLLLVFAGILLAVFLYHLAHLLSDHTPLRYGWAIAIVLLSLVAVTAAAGWLLIPPFVEQAQQLGDQLPRAFDALRARAGHIGWLSKMLESAGSGSRLVGSRADMLARITGFFSTTLGVLANLLVIFFVALYLAVSPGTYHDGVLRLVPPGSRPRAQDVLHSLGETLWWWLLAKLVSMAVIGILTSIGLWALGMPLATALAVVAALLTFIPNFGPILAAAPAVLIALSRSPNDALYVAILYTAVQFVETYLITPVIQKRAVDLPPALSLVAQALLGVLVGGLGVILASPLCAAGLVLVRKLYVEDWLGDHSKGES